MYMMPVVHWYSKQCKHPSNVDKPFRWPKAGNSNHMYKYACDQTPVHLMYTAGEWSGKSMDKYVSAIYQVISFINIYHYLVQCVAFDVYFVISSYGSDSELKLHAAHSREDLLCLSFLVLLCRTTSLTSIRHNILGHLVRITFMQLSYIIGSPLAFT